MAVDVEAHLPHVVMLPFPAQGHIKPMFMLAKLLSHAGGLNITFVNTDHNHHLLLQQINQTDIRAVFPSIHFVSISDGLPPEHTRSGLSFIDLLDSVPSVSKPKFRDLVFSLIHGETEKEWSPPTCIIADGVMSFAIDAAEEFGIPVIVFRTHCATGTWVYFYIQKLVQEGKVPFKGEDMNKEVTCIPGLETTMRYRDLPSLCRLEVDHPYVQFILHQTSQLKRASSLILNTFQELEDPIISQLHSIFSNVYTVGPLDAHLSSHLATTSNEPSSNGSLMQQDRTCLTWLETQQPKSVVYVSFGSLVALTRDQIMELWCGLVNSDKPFLWVIRPDLVWNGGGLGEITQEILKGTRERGCIVGWAPQEEVLGHRAIGAFFTHSGWNSILEAISSGVPMICWPQFADQQVNSRCVQEIWRVGLDMKDTCDRLTVEEMVRELMDGKCEKILESSKDFARLARDSVQEGGSSYRNFEKLIEEIRSMNLAKLEI